MDAFFASVEQRDNPALRGRPIAVGHDGPRGVVATASYEARPFGVHSAMAVATAKRKCRHLIVVEPRFEVYKEVSGQIREIFSRYTDLVEPLSLDEAFLDVSHHPSATIVAREIKQLIRQTTGLTASAGVSVNKMIAKIASDYRKPDGLFVVPPDQVEAFVAQLPVEKFFGVGQVTAAKMHKLGLHTGTDLRQADPIQMVRWFGRAGLDYHRYGFGIDQRPVIAERERKSVGSEITFVDDLSTPEQLQAELRDIAAHTWERVQRSAFRGKTVVLKMKFDDFHQITRSVSFDRHVESLPQLLEAGLRLLEACELHDHKVRLLGLTVANPVAEPPDSGQLLLPFDPF